MVNMAKVLKDEIARLSRREVKKSASPLGKKMVVLSRTVSRQKKIIAELTKKIDRMEKLVGASQTTPSAAPVEEVKKARISPRLVKTQRKRLKLNQAGFAKLLGVSVAAVRSWEQGRSVPRGANLAVFVSVRKLKRSEAYDRLGIKPKRKKRVARKKPVTAKKRPATKKKAASKKRVVRKKRPATKKKVIRKKRAGAKKRPATKKKK